MGRDNYNFGAGEMTNNSRQNQMVRDAANRVGISVQELSDAVHQRKDEHYHGDFTYAELIEIAEEIKKFKERR